jgi:DNA-binding IclR family transcriptional regulator
MTWREAVEAAVRRHASKSPNRTFNRQDFLAEEQARILSDCGGGGETPQQTISRVLQELRDSGVIKFLDDQGTYQLIS